MLLIKYNYLSVIVAILLHPPSAKQQKKIHAGSKAVAGCIFGQPLDPIRVILDRPAFRGVVCAIACAFVYCVCVHTISP